MKEIKIDPIIETFSGHKFDLFDESDTRSITIIDIAHALSLNCRYNGHCKKFYSVAEHSVHCSYLVPEEFAFDALMHDASEAYLSDIPRPFKAHIGNYKEIETRVQKRIARRFGFDEVEPAIVKSVDTGILWLEAQHLMRSRGDWWTPDVEEHYNQFIDVDRLPNGGLELWTPEQAEHKFLERFVQLKGY